MRWLFVFIFAIFNVGQTCANEIIFEDALIAFQNTLYPALKSQCAKCHGDQGPETPHSVSDVKVAYSNTKQLVNFSDIENSRFMKMIQKKHWLKDDPTSVGFSVDEARQHLHNWWTQGESQSQSNTFSYISTDVTIPVPLPLMTIDPTKFVVLSWDLSQTAQNLSGCRLTLEIQQARSSTDEIPASYRVKNPTMWCLNQKIKISGLYFAVNGILAPYENIFSEVSAQVDASHVLLSSQIMILIARSTQDSLRVLIQHVAYDLPISLFVKPFDR